MSTADGLVISSSQIVANDRYRRTLIPRMSVDHSPEEVDRRVLLISRITTVFILLGCIFMARSLMDRNVAMIVWIGIGGMMAAFSGPLIVGAVWKGVTKKGAYAGLLAGMATFIVLHASLIDPTWFVSYQRLFQICVWLSNQAPNPFACAFLGEVVSVGMTILVSAKTEKLPDAHLDNLFHGHQTS